MKPLRILLVEDDHPVRHRLRDALERSPDVVVSAVGSIEEARSALLVSPPHVLVSDLHLPDGNGVDLISEVHERFPRIEILVISILCDERNVVSAIEAGASGYVLKDALPEDILETVQQVLSGQSPISPAVARFILRRIQAPRCASDASSRLTKRESDVLWGIAKGLTYAEIANGLGLSQKTVPNYIKSIYRKLNVNSRGEAVYEAINRQLIRL